MQKPKMNKNKEKSIKRLEARGFAHMDNTTMSTTMGLVDGDGFFQKVVVNRRGIIKRYKPEKLVSFISNAFLIVTNLFKYFQMATLFN